MNEGNHFENNLKAEDFKKKFLEPVNENKFLKNYNKDQLKNFDYD